ncbi:hypothetical protein ACOMHN_014142 [Nucella lapillus]
MRHKRQKPESHTEEYGVGGEKLSLSLSLSLSLPLLPELPVKLLPQALKQPLAPNSPSLSFSFRPLFAGARRLRGPDTYGATNELMANHGAYYIVDTDIMAAQPAEISSLIGSASSSLNDSTIGRLVNHSRFRCVCVVGKRWRSIVSLAVRG